MRRKRSRREVCALKGRLMSLGWRGIYDWADIHGFKRETARKTVYRYWGKKTPAPYGETTIAILRALAETLRHRRRPPKYHSRDAA